MMVSRPSATLESILSAGVITTVPSQGVDLAVVSWPGDDTVVLFAHPTGFHKEIWVPTVRSLRERGVTATLVAVDLRGHGDSPEPPSDPSVWDFARDLSCVAQEFATASGQMIGVGHSLGGAAVTGAEILDTGTFAAMVLIDPALITPANAAQMVAAGMNNWWADTARRRRPEFSSRDDALEAYAAKAVFATWPTEVLELYIDHGFTEHEGAWRLKCRPEWEAATFSQPDYPELWRHLATLAPPVTLITAEHSATHPTDIAAETAEALSSHHVRLAGITHFVPMEMPDAIATEIIPHLNASAR